jgi:CheY-like chemotaxis protein
MSAVRSPILPTTNNYLITVLIVDDASIIQMVLGRILQNSNISTIGVLDGDQAVRAITGHEFRKWNSTTKRDAISPPLEDRVHAIVMDQEMPNLKGTEATLQIRDYESQFERPRTPIIGYTTLAKQEDEHHELPIMSEFMEAGADLVLPKPSSNKDLPKIIFKLIDSIPKKC